MTLCSSFLLAAQTRLYCREKFAMPLPYDHGVKVYTPHNVTAAPQWPPAALQRLVAGPTEPECSGAEPEAGIMRELFIALSAAEPKDFG